MKLVINIPCYNEEKTLPLVLQAIPKKIPGIDVIEVQIVDDGSTDQTVSTARKFGVKRVIQHKKNLGLGIAFKHGMEAALAAGADVMVNLDGDHAFPPDKIADLVKPIVEKRADMVVGDRQPWKVQHYSLIKRMFQYFGNALVRKLADVNVPDMVCGFRAYSRETMLRLNITTKFSYVLDTIVQAARKGLTIESVYILANPPTRKSRLFKNIFEHMSKSGMNLLRLYMLYEPFRTFLWSSSLFFIPSAILIGRYVTLRYVMQYSGSLLVSTTVAAILLVLGGLMLTLGALGELLAMNRRLQEEQLYLQQKYHYEK